MKKMKPLQVCVEILKALVTAVCNRGQLVRAVWENITPLISRGTQATDARDCIVYSVLASDVLGFLIATSYCDKLQHCVTTKDQSVFRECLFFLQILSIQKNSTLKVKQISTFSSIFTIKLKSNSVILH